MTTLRLMALVLGAALTLLSAEYIFAMSAEKKGAESAKEPIGTSPSMELRKKTFEKNRMKKTVDDFFSQMDGDKDDKVSHDEFMVPMEDRFKGMDSNHDGFITREEFEISFKKHREMRMKTMQRQPTGKMPPRMPPK